MSKEAVGQNGAVLGSSDYWDRLNRSSRIGTAMQRTSEPEYFEAVKRIGQRAASAIDAIYDDLQKNKKAMLSFLEAHYAEELTLERIAESAGISATEAMRCFRRSIGVSPIRFLKERRLQRAAGMLRNTEQSISEIAASCGFWDMSYFTKVFRQLYGLTPTAYRGGNQR